MVNRRKFLLQSSASLIASFLLKGCKSASQRTSQSIVVGSLLDATGPISIVGVEMIAATELAIAEINDAGGLLGRTVTLKQYDTQSDIQKYIQYAQQLILRDKVHVLIGGITSASREAIRPVINRYKTLYFYSIEYEGGVCDKYTFCTGATPSGQLDKLFRYMASQFKAKTIYTLAANYNYGQAIAKWTRFYGNKYGMNVIQEDFLPLDVSDFSTTLSRIQQAKPDMILAIIVGTNQAGFYDQWAAAGLQGKIPLTSVTFKQPYIRDSSQKPQWAEVIVSSPYWLEDPSDANQQFLARFRQKFGNDKYPSSLAVAQYTAVKVWAEGVKKAETIEREAVTKVLEEGSASYDNGPLGRVAFDKTHHTRYPINILESNENQGFDRLAGPFPNLAAMEDQGQCNLITRPNTSKQFTPNFSPKP